MSKKPKLTPWIDGSAEKPFLLGVYMLLSGNRSGYQHWDGVQWGIWATTPEMAKKYRNTPANLYYQNDNWRGLAQKP